MFVGDYNAEAGNLSEFEISGDFIGNIQNCDNVFQSLNVYVAYMYVYLITIIGSDCLFHYLIKRQDFHINYAV